MPPWGLLGCNSDFNRDHLVTSTVARFRLLVEVLSGGWRRDAVNPASMRQLSPRIARTLSALPMRQSFASQAHWPRSEHRT
jgi:hypothetical protein